jgi:hypothetical protein
MTSQTDLEGCDPVIIYDFGFTYLSLDLTHCVHMIIILFCLLHSSAKRRL